MIGLEIATWQQSMPGLNGWQEFTQKYPGIIPQSAGRRSLHHN